MMMTSNLSIRLDDELREQTVQALASFDYDKKSPDYEKSAVTMKAITAAREGKLTPVGDISRFLADITQ